MKEVQRHNFEFIRTEVLKLSIDDFAGKLEISPSSYKRMKSAEATAEYHFMPIQKACELADISIDVFSTQHLTREIYAQHKGTYKKSQL